MNEPNAKSVTVAAVGTAGVLSSLEYIADGQRPPLAVGIGVVVSGVVLLALCEVAPNLGAALAALLLVGALLRNGTSFASQLSTSLGK